MENMVQFLKVKNIYNLLTSKFEPIGFGSSNSPLLNEILNQKTNNCGPSCYDREKFKIS